jgi:hypothetical protein
LRTTEKAYGIKNPPLRQDRRERRPVHLILRGAGPSPPPPAISTGQMLARLDERAYILRG